jgi:hypothetical protein
MNNKFMELMRKKVELPAYRHLFARQKNPSNPLSEALRYLQKIFSRRLRRATLYQVPRTQLKKLRHVPLAVAERRRTLTGT